MTADVSVNHLHLIDHDIGYFNAAMRLTPPLRQQRDRDAIRAALADGTIDALVSDHTPVAADAKNLPFAEAEPGATGLELLLALALKWGEQVGLPLAQSLATVTSRAAAVVGAAFGATAASAGTLQVGGTADLCLFGLDHHWTADTTRFRSQGRHTPFANHELPGPVRVTVIGGRVAYERDA